MKKEALRVTSTIPVAPTTLYFAWIDSTHHTSMTGQTAKIDPVVGAKYSCCNGYVTGKLVILDLGRRIVESWRTTDFPRDAADSRVEVHFETLGLSTRILILHTEIPEGSPRNTRRCGTSGTSRRCVRTSVSSCPTRGIPRPSRAASPPEMTTRTRTCRSRASSPPGSAAAKGQKPTAAPKAAPSGPGLARPTQGRQARQTRPCRGRQARREARQARREARQAPRSPPSRREVPPSPSRRASRHRRLRPRRSPSPRSPRPRSPLRRRPAKKPAAKKPAAKPAKGKKKR